MIAIAPLANMITSCSYLAGIDALRLQADLKIRIAKLESQIEGTRIERNDIAEKLK